jgi:hypothetical protein
MLVKNPNNRIDLKKLIEILDENYISFHLKISDLQKETKK